MHQRTRCLAVFLAILLLLTAVFPAAAASSSGNLETQYKQKIIAVVFDDSGSMDVENRFPAARYSLAMLASMLDERDEMHVIPMNQGPADGYPVNLSASNRTAEIDGILKKLSYANGGTPSSSMGKAVDVLINSGLKDAQNLIDSDPDKEYWLVVLTDGTFDNEDDERKQAEKVKLRIDSFPTLHTVYVSFGSGAVDISGQEVLENYPLLSTYCKIPVNKLVATVQTIANQISGRYPLTSANSRYEVDGKTVRVDLTSIPFSLSALSVIAQNCGASIESVSYESSDPEAERPNLSLTNVCTVKPDAALGLREGCAFSVDSSRFLQGGTLILNFSAPVTVDQLSVFATPALHVSYYFEAIKDGDWQRVDVQYINANLRPGDQIRAGYEVLDQLTGDPIDLEKTFGDVEAKFVYNQKVFAAGDPIPLIAGTTELTVEVSVMQGAYTLRDSEILTVEEDPSFFRIEVQGDTEVIGSSPTADASFTVYVDNQPAGPDVLKNYVCTLTAADSDGNILFQRSPQADANGRIAASLPIKTNAFGVYTLTLTVQSPHRTSRTAEHKVTYAPDTLVITPDGAGHLSVTQYDLISNTDGFTFLLTANGQPFPFDNTLTEYKLLADGTDVTDAVSVSGNVLTYVPTAANLGSASDTPGDKEILLTLTSASRPSLNASASVKLTVIKTDFTVKPLSTDTSDINRFDLKNCTASLAFSVERDNVPLTAEELAALYDSGKIRIETTPLFTFPLFPAGTEASVETVDGTAAVVIRAVKDMPAYFEWHFSAFITGGDKTVTVSYGDASAEDAFTVIGSNIFQHILRIAMLILVLLMIAYVTAYLLGFLIAKPLPTGVFIKIDSDGSNMLVYVNERPIKYILWHLSRLNPLIIWKNQSPLTQAPYCDGILLSHGKRQKILLSPTEENAIFRLRNADGMNTILSQFHTSIATNPIDLSTLLDHEGVKAEELFDVSPDAVPLAQHTTAALSSSQYYGYYLTDSYGNREMIYALCFYNLNR